MVIYSIDNESHEAVKLLETVDTPDGFSDVIAHYLAFANQGELWTTQQDCGSAGADGGQLYSYVKENGTCVTAKTLQDVQERLKASRGISCGFTGLERQETANLSVTGAYMESMQGLEQEQDEEDGEEEILIRV